MHRASSVRLRPQLLPHRVCRSGEAHVRSVRVQVSEGTLDRSGPLADPGRPGPEVMPPGRAFENVQGKGRKLCNCTRSASWGHCRTMSGWIMHAYAWCIDRGLRSHETCNITDARARAHPISGAIQLCTPNAARTRDGKTTPGWDGECCEGPVGPWVPSCISGSSVGMHPGPQTRSGVQDCVRTLMHLDCDFNDFHAVALAFGP